MHLYQSATHCNLIATVVSKCTEIAVKSPASLFLTFATNAALIKVKGFSPYHLEEGNDYLYTQLRFYSK